MDNSLLIGYFDIKDVPNKEKKPMTKPKLTPKQKRFVEEYIIDLNATRAAKAAGYSEKTAYRTGCDNLNKPQVAKSIAELKAVQSARCAVNADYVINNLKEIVNRSMNPRSVKGRISTPQTRR